MGEGLYKSLKGTKSKPGISNSSVKFSKNSDGIRWRSKAVCKLISSLIAVVSWADRNLVGYLLVRCALAFSASSDTREGPEPHSAMLKKPTHFVKWATLLDDLLENKRGVLVFGLLPSQIWGLAQSRDADTLPNCIGHPETHRREWNEACLEGCHHQRAEALWSQGLRACWGNCLPKSCIYIFYQQCGKAVPWTYWWWFEMYCCSISVWKKYKPHNQNFKGIF